MPDNPYEIKPPTVLRATKPRDPGRFKFAKRKPRPPVSRGGKSKQHPTDAPRLEDVVLRTSHNINGQQYGPGRVKVPEGIAAMLREQESRVVESEERFYGQRAFLVARVQTPGGIRGVKPMPVPYETFTDSLNAANPMGTAHGTAESPAKWED